MKTMLSIAAVLAAFASASTAFADNSPAAVTHGHYEWQTRPISGPNKSNISPQIRVWVKDATNVASCDCAMMHANATSADCMTMPHKDSGPSHG